jgi:nucleotide-binding universal stress UspA family protein
MTDILLAVDDDEHRAQLQAETVVDLDWVDGSVSVTVAHVFTDNVEGASISQFAPARVARDTLEENGIDVTLEESSGDPADQIIGLAERRDADLVCVAGRKRSPAGKAVFGSVSQTVMLDSDIPVLFCPFEA